MRLFLVTFLLFMSQTASAIEEAKYKLIEAQGSFELRAYEPKITAHVSVSGSLKKASNSGFRLVVDYIFGNNTAKNISDHGDGKSNKKIKMTAPVIVESDAEQWRVSFVMPNK